MGEFRTKGYVIKEFKEHPIKFLTIAISLFVLGQIIESLFGSPIQNWFQNHVWNNEFFVKNCIPFVIGIIVPIFLLILTAYILFKKENPTPKNILEQQSANQIQIIDKKDIKQEEIELITVLREVGIVGATTKLSETRFEPRECMRKAKKHIFFMGILGSKWVNTHGGEFESFLRKIEAQHGEVRFLLIDPKGKAYAKLVELREGAIKEESLDRFYEFSQKYNCLRVKLYDDLPSFRLILIDESTLAVSRYKLDRYGHFESKYGWEAPHIVITADSSWSLYWSFEHYYHSIWVSSKDLKDYMAEKENKV